MPGSHGDVTSAACSSAETHPHLRATSVARPAQAKTLDIKESSLMKPPAVPNSSRSWLTRVVCVGLALAGILLCQGSVLAQAQAPQKIILRRDRQKPVRARAIAGAQTAGGSGVGQAQLSVLSTRGTHGVADAAAATGLV